MTVVVTTPMLPEIHVSLGTPPRDRWAALRPYAGHARALIDLYLRDIGGLDRFGPMLDGYRAAFLDATYSEEIDGVAALVERPPQEVLLTNLYYDALKSVLMGCTAVAIDTPNGPLHARNLDWMTEQRMLSTHTQVAQLRDGPMGPVKLVGWPGFVGAFSGVAEGRFAVTLNAVLSDDPPALAPPMTFLIRTALEQAKDFDAAVRLLSETPVASDSLLLVTGIRSGEMAVIERSPRRHAIRTAVDGVLVVTNDYRALPSNASAPTTELGRTACSRFDAATALARARPPRNANDCLAILENTQVKMGITVQHMAMRASTGELVVRVPDS